MEEGRKLFICSTVYQLIVAIQIKCSMFREKKVDIIVTDEIKDAERVSKKLNESGLFEHCIVVMGKNTKLEKGKIIYIMPLYKTMLKKTISYDNCIIAKKDRYGEIFFANVGGLNYRLAAMMLSYNTRAFLSMFEEGVATYSRIHGDVFEKRNSLKSNIVFHTLRMTKKLYVFNPQIITWEPHMEVVKIPDIKENDMELISLLNGIFAYKDIQDSYSERVIFFEESYFADGIYVRDVELVKKIENIYGKDNIFIKSHPRSKTNRFKELGYKTNKDTVLPWEVIALNINLSEKVLVSMTSSAVVNSFLLFHSGAKLILDYQNMPLENNRIRKTIEVIERIKEIYPNTFGFI